MFRTADAPPAAPASQRARNRQRSRLAALRRICRAAGLVPGLFSGGASSEQVVNALVPHDDFRLIADQAYAGVPRCRLDLYLPATGTVAAPVVVFFHGGGWVRGAKDEYLFLGEALASRGFIVVIPNYRLYPEARYPAFLEDGAAALAWTWRHVAGFGGDPARVSLMGHSAGAYIAAMLAVDTRWLGAERARIRNAVGLAGPYDFLPLTEPVHELIFAAEPDLARTQPISFADGTAPPLLLVSGRSDSIVDVGNSARLATRIHRHGGRVAERYYDRLGHAAVIGAMARPLRFIAPVLDEAAAFLADHPPTGATLHDREPDSEIFGGCEAHS